MLTLLFAIVQLLLGGAIAYVVFQLAKSPQGGRRALGWGVGALFSWWLLKGLWWDARLIFWGQWSQLFYAGVHGYLLATTVACLVKGSKQAPGSLPDRPKPLLQRRLPRQG